MNDSLDDLLDLLRAEIARLKVDLETFRLTRNPNREALIAQLIRAIDERQDRLEALQALRLERAPSTASNVDGVPGIDSEPNSGPQVH